MAEEERPEKEYPAEEQGIEPEKTEEEKKLDMEVGEKEEEVYSEEGREALVEDAEIEPWEEGFMEGAEGPGQQGKCRQCGAELLTKEGTVEKEIDGEVRFFCSNKCLEKYEQEH
jgi:hypothetical protein